MVSSGTDNAYANAVAFIPSGIAINNVDAVSSIEIVDSTFPVDFPYLGECRISTEVQRAKENPGGEPRHENGSCRSHSGKKPSL